MRSHISVHGATTKFCDNPFVFKNAIEKEGLPKDSTPALGAGGLRFESGRPDQFICYIHMVGVVSSVDLCHAGWRSLPPAS